MSSEPLPTWVFDDSHYALTILQKLKRSVQLGPKYYALDLPRYLYHRKSLNLPWCDLGAFWNPIREFRRKPYHGFFLPPRYAEALWRLHEAGVRLTMPRNRLEALLGAWWAAREVPGDVIECGSYRGATALLLALLGHWHHVPQTVLMLDTFQGIPQTSSFDVARQSGEFVPSANQVEVIQDQARSLQVLDRVEICQGLFAEAFASLEKRHLQFAFVHVDANIYQGTLEACRFTIPRLSPGGTVVFDDYNGVCDLGARLAIDQFLAGYKARPIPLAGSSALVQVGV